MRSAVAEVRLARVTWRPCWRIIPSRYPPIQLFERVAQPSDLDALFELEAMTNDRLRDAVGELSLVAPEDRLIGPNASIAMAPFTHLNPTGGRFSDANHGAYYAARDLPTAVAETRHHRGRFLAATREAPMALDMRAYLADFSTRLHDVRKCEPSDPIYHPEDYAASQAFARTLRDHGSDGIVYHSVRRSGGQCVALFRPRLLSNIRLGPRLIYKWDGETIAEVLETSEIK